MRARHSECIIAPERLDRQTVSTARFHLKITEKLRSFLPWPLPPIHFTMGRSRSDRGLS